MDWTYLVLVLPFVLLAMLASARVKSVYRKYAAVCSRRGLTADEAARRVLAAGGVTGVSMDRIQGDLTDHYDPRANAIRLSDSVAGSTSVAAIGVACHEAGHAIQHATAYAPLNLRTAMVPVVQFGSQIGVWVILAGAMLNIMGLALLGVALFSASVLFAIVTLPVEWDASARAKKLMVASGIVIPSEERDAGSVLNAAFLTYVGAAVSSIGTLLYYLVRLGLIGGRRRD